MKEVEKQIYRVEGFSCANCAGKFERNVKALPGVEDAKVNFGASKITVFGHATVEELERAGAFENLKVYPDKVIRKSSTKKEDQQESTVPFYEKYQTLLFSGLLIVLGYVSTFVNGEDNLITVLLFISSIIIGGYSLFKVGLNNLIHLDFDMRTLMTVAIIGAAIIGEWAEGAIVVILFAISENLERYSMDQARKSIRSLMELAPNEALIRRGGEELILPVEEIKIGDIMIVKPGQKIAMDGVVVKGTSTVNEAAITGESIPVEKKEKDEVYAGTLNEEGLLEIRITKYVEDTTLSKIIELVEEAQEERAPAQAFIDRFAKYYTPIIMIIALHVAIVPPLFFGGVWLEWIYQGLAVLVVGCPCALVISTPISIVSAIGSAAKKGVLIKGGIYLEEMGSLKAIAFDKTGTLTKGLPVVTDVKVMDEGSNEKEILAIAYALEKSSSHPLASAIVRRAEEAGVNHSELVVEQFKSITGKGIQATIGGETYYIGSPNLFIEIFQSGLMEVIQKEATTLQNEGKTVMFLGTKEKILAVFAVRDELRETSKEMLEKLHEFGIEKTVLLTGDNEATAKAIGIEAGILEVKADLMPEDKLEFVKTLRKQYGKVAMVGDGVNDAPALAAATVGIAMGGAGTDTALETADVAFMSDDLSKLPFTIKLSRKALAIIKTNIAFALAVKLLALLLVVPGWLTLWIAIFSDMGATLLVTLNSMRLLRVRE
ncbi:heavy metal translocating P-type ATPase [Ureibacillus thermosphaericus]|uniref:heavy metal translocating P-type ATPase n=1 Tax=Ureibacillus thermosphaericus TaxID=51173 RepID=UPI000BBC7AD2|nr:heavy metal translocating P-type ATPase [Ureibacillus thermosphaericus]